MDYYNYNSILEYLKSQLPSLTSSQRKVADYVLKNPVNVAFSTINELAATCGVSTNTIVRLTSFLGCSGYSVFQDSIREYLTQSINKQPFSTEIGQIPTSEFKQTLFDIAAVQLDNIKDTYSRIDSDDLDAAVNRIMNAKRIIFCGTGNCKCIVNYLYVNISHIRNTQMMSVFTSADLAEALSSISDGDVVFAASLPRYSRFTVDFAKEAKEHGAFVVAITDSYKAPIIKNADVTLVAENNKTDFHNSIVSSCFVVDMILYKCIEKDRESAEKKYHSIESIHSNTDYYYTDN